MIFLIFLLKKSNKEQKSLLSEESYLKNSQSSQKLKNEEKELKLKKEKSLAERASENKRNYEKKVQAEVDLKEKKRVFFTIFFHEKKPFFLKLQETLGNAREEGNGADPEAAKHAILTKTSL